MRRSLHVWLFLAAGALSRVPASASSSAEAASPLSEVSVTVYRAAYRNGNSLDLDDLGGFALVTETRTISIPAGVSRLRFEGVADGIQPATAIITGLPSGLLEKNHDAKVLSPAELVTASIGKNVWLVRANPKTGESTKVRGSILADADGVVFKGPEGLEALRCSGLPETFQFDSTLQGAATPTLSALIRSPRAITATVRLSYLAQGFDWMANYVATVAPDGKTMDLGAWVTLANANATSFSDAHAQVVAGRLNRESEEVEPVDEGAQIVAQCWPRGSTSDTPESPNIVPARPLMPGLEMYLARAFMKAAAPAPMSSAIQAIAVTGAKVLQEQLGDLKLYRVPERTSVASRQIKQVRLLDRKDIPIDLFYRADLTADVQSDDQPLSKVLRTRNDTAHHLDLPLPSGQVATFYEHDGVPLLVHEAPLRDITLDEEVEIEAGEAPDLRVTSKVEGRTVNGATVKKLPLIPGVHIRSREIDVTNRVEVTNARNQPAVVELRLTLNEGAQLVRADHTPFMHNGHQTFRLTVPAEGSAIVEYQTVDTRYSPEPE